MYICFEFIKIIILLHVIFFTCRFVMFMLLHDVFFFFAEFCIYNLYFTNKLIMNYKYTYVAVNNATEREDLCFTCQALNHKML